MKKYFLDNLRYSVVLLVVVFHVIYLFNSVGVITTVTIPGIPFLDVFEYIVYPWFMMLLFIVSGVSAKYSLERQTNLTFLKDRLQRHLIPSIMDIFLVGWLTVWVYCQYVDLSAYSKELQLITYMIIAIGALWYMHQLFVANLILLLIRKIDTQNYLLNLGSKINMFAICLMVIVIYISSQMFNSDIVWTYRNGIYIVAFLLGYMMFSHENIQNMIAKRTEFFLTLSAILAVIYIILYWGKNYTDAGIQQSFVTNAYAWFGSLGLFGAAKKWFNKKNQFTEYMRDRSFGIYVLHYPIMSFLAYVLDKWLHMDVRIMYILIVPFTLIILHFLIPVLKRVPVLKALILGKN